MKNILIVLLVFISAVCEAQVPVVDTASSAKISQDFLNKLDSLGVIDSAANAKMKYNKGVELMDLKSFKEPIDILLKEING